MAVWVRKWKTRAWANGKQRYLAVTTMEKLGKKPQRASGDEEAVSQKLYNLNGEWHSRTSWAAKMDADI